MSDPRTDPELLEAYRSGDDDALSVLLARHAAAVQRFGVKMCRDPEDAKDVLQDTLLAAARGAREFRGASSLSTWMPSFSMSLASFALGCSPLTCLRIWVEVRFRTFAARSSPVHFSTFTFRMTMVPVSFIACPSPLCYVFSTR